MRCKAAWWYSAALAAAGSLHLILYVRYVHTRIVRGVRRKLFVMYAFLTIAANLKTLKGVKYREKATEVAFELFNEALEGFILADLNYFGANFWVVALSNESATEYALLKDKADNVLQGFGNKPFDIVVPHPHDDILYRRRVSMSLEDVREHAVVFICSSYRFRRSLVAEFKNFVRDFKELDDPEFFERYDLNEYIVDGYKTESERDAWIQGRYAEMSYKKEVKRRAVEESLRQERLAAEKAARAEEARAQAREKVRFMEESLRQERLAAEKAARAEEACAQAREKVRFIAASRAAAKAAREAKIAQEVLNFREEIETMEAIRLQWSLNAPSEMEAAVAEAEAELDEQFARRLDFINEANSLTEVLAESAEPAPVQQILGKLGFYWGYMSLVLCVFLGVIAYVVM